MSDTEDNADWFAVHEQRREQERMEARQRMAKACDSLATLGVAVVCIQYDGYGDSGAVNTVTGTDGTEEIDIPAAIQETLIAAAECLLPHGWENGEGAFGVLVLDIASRQLRREHHWRVESTEYEEEVWEL